MPHYCAGRGRTGLFMFVDWLGGDQGERWCLAPRPTGGIAVNGGGEEFAFKNSSRFKFRVLDLEPLQLPPAASRGGGSGGGTAGGNVWGKNNTKTRAL